MEDQEFSWISSILFPFLYGSAGAFVTFFAERWWEIRLMVAKKEASLVATDWSGHYIQMVNEEEVSTELALSLKARWKRVSGKFKYDSKELHCSGGFFQSRILTLHYWTTEAIVLQHGSIVVRLSDSGKNLVGYFIGHGPDTESLIHGSVELERVK